MKSKNTIRMDEDVDGDSEWGLRMILAEAGLIEPGDEYAQEMFSDGCEVA